MNKHIVEDGRLESLDVVCGNDLPDGSYIISSCREEDDDYWNADQVFKRMCSDKERIEKLERELSAKQAEVEDLRKIITRIGKSFDADFDAFEATPEFLTRVAVSVESLKAAQGGLSKAISDFCTYYQTEYEKELQSCDTWIKWCEDNNDSHGMNFHQGKQSSHISLDITMRSLLKSLEVLTLPTPPVERSVDGE